MSKERLLKRDDIPAGPERRLVFLRQFESRGFDLAYCETCETVGFLEKDKVLLAVKEPTRGFCVCCKAVMLMKRVEATP